MFDLKFYGLIAELFKYHNEVNNYNNKFGKRILTREDLIEKQLEILRKYMISEMDYGELVIYMRFIIIYFAKYQLSVAEKQHKQIVKNFWNVKWIADEIV